MASRMATRHEAYRSSRAWRVRIRNEAQHLARWRYHWPKVVARKRS